VLTEAAKQTLAECGVPYRDLRLRYQPDYGEGGSLLLTVEVQTTERRNTVITLFDMGIGSPGSEYFLRNITSFTMRGMWHRIDAVVVV
jgi:hypothetical protein